MAAYWLMPAHISIQHKTTYDRHNNLHTGKGYDAFLNITTTVVIFNSYSIYNEHKRHTFKKW